ncbi:MAG: hypothetical protein ACRDZ4_11310 [Egibacteraceae bacterium]
MTVERDPSRARVEEAVVVVTTDCCKKRMVLPRRPVDLAEPRRLWCFWCGRSRWLRLVTDSVGGVRTVWSDPPGTRRRRWRSGRW